MVILDGWNLLRYHCGLYETRSYSYQMSSHYALTIINLPFGCALVGTLTCQKASDFGRINPSWKFSGTYSILYSLQIILSSSALRFVNSMAYFMGILRARVGR